MTFHSDKPYNNSLVMSFFMHAAYINDNKLITMIIYMYMLLVFIPLIGAMSMICYNTDWYNTDMQYRSFLWLT